MHLILTEYNYAGKTTCGQSYTQTVSEKVDIVLFDCKRNVGAQKVLPRTPLESWQRSPRRSSDYISYIGEEFPTQANSTKIRSPVGVADTINHTKFAINDQLKEYKIISSTPGSILQWLVAYNTVARLCYVWHTLYGSPRHLVLKDAFFFRACSVLRYYTYENVTLIACNDRHCCSLISVARFCQDPPAYPEQWSYLSVRSSLCRLYSHSPAASPIVGSRVWLFWTGPIVKCIIGRI